MSSSGSESDRGDDFDTLKINEGFAARFEHNAKRKLLEKGKAKYGENFERAEESSESSSSEDDSEAELLNPRVEQKFLEVLTTIKNDPKKLLSLDKPIFDDDDFEEGGAGPSKKKSEKPLTLKDQIREHTLKKMKASSSGEDEDDDSSDSDDGERRAKKTKGDSGLFTKLGVT